MILDPTRAGTPVTGQPIAIVALLAALQIDLRIAACGAERHEFAAGIVDPFTGVLSRRCRRDTGAG